MATKRTILEVYALAVCLVSLACFIIVLGVGIYNIVEISNPEFTMRSRIYEKHMSNEAFTLSWPKDRPIPGQAELTRLRKASYARALKMEQRRAAQSLVRVGIIMTIDTIVFLVHWFLAARVRNRED